MELRNIKIQLNGHTICPTTDNPSYAVPPVVDCDTYLKKKSEPNITNIEFYTPFSLERVWFTLKLKYPLDLKTIQVNIYFLYLFNSFVYSALYTLFHRHFPLDLYFIWIEFLFVSIHCTILVKSDLLSFIA